MSAAAAGRVAGIPVLRVDPASGPDGAPLALWLPPFGLVKEDMRPSLDRLAAAGFAAVSLDPPEHGERGSEPADELRARVFAAFRDRMWPILAVTTLDCMRVIDWAVAELGTRADVVAGGVSMGGDIAVALAGADHRVARVAAMVATPDWTRPGMRDLRDPSRVVPQGEAGAYARWLCERLNPMANLAAYMRGPAILFECGADDVHVPADGAERFRAALAKRDPALRERIRVNVVPGLGHLEGARSEAALARCVEWLSVGYSSRRNEGISSASGGIVN